MPKTKAHISGQKGNDTQTLYRVGYKRTDLFKMVAEEMKDAVRVCSLIGAWHDCMFTGTLVEFSFLFG